MFEHISFLQNRFNIWKKTINRAVVQMYKLSCFSSHQIKFSVTNRKITSKNVISDYNYKHMLRYKCVQELSFKYYLFLSILTKRDFKSTK